MSKGLNLPRKGESWDTPSPCSTSFPLRNAAKRGRTKGCLEWPQSAQLELFGHFLHQEGPTRGLQTPPICNNGIIHSSSLREKTGNCYVRFARLLSGQEHSELPWPDKPWAAKGKGAIFTLQDSIALRPLGDLWKQAGKIDTYAWRA